MSRRGSCWYGILNRLRIDPARRKMHFVLVQPDQSVAANTLHRLHLRSYVSVPEWSTTRLIHSLLVHCLLRVYSMLAFSSCRVHGKADGVLGLTVPEIHEFWYSSCPGSVSGHPFRDERPMSPQCHLLLLDLFCRFDGSRAMGHAVDHS